MSSSGVAVPAGIPISTNIEVLHDSGKSYFVTIADAKRLTATSQAKWDGPKRIKLTANSSKRTTWSIRVSGYVLARDIIPPGRQFSQLNGQSVLQLT